MTERYVLQDGGDFYIYLTNEAEEPQTVRHYPAIIADHDLESAKRARVWFLQLYPREEFIFV